MCLCPVTVTREIAGRKYQQVVPCGKCPECIKDKQNEYMIRTVEESYKVTGVWFITLTYNEDSVPNFDIDGEVDEETGEVEQLNVKTLNNYDITTWKKRVKMRLERVKKSKLDMKYIICGEYGPRTNRPHYHGLLMNISDKDVYEFKKDWEQNYGFTCFKKVPMLEISKVGKYIVKYITKVRELENPLVLKGLVQKPRKISSIGFGRPTVERLAKMRREVLCENFLKLEDIDDLSNVPVLKLNALVKKIAKKRYYHLDGRDYKLPNYYKRLLFYVKDENKGTLRATQLSKMVSKAIQDDLVEDFNAKLAELATRNGVSKDSEEFAVLAKDLCDSEQIARETRCKIVLQNNRSALRKSRF